MPFLMRVGFVLIPLVLACASDDEEACEEGDARCDGDVVQSCNGSGVWEDAEDCAESDEMCDESMGGCMEMDD